TRKDFPWTNSHHIADDLRMGVQKLKDATPDGVLLGSGKLATALDRLDLIDEYKLLVHPRIAGHGPTLYESGLPSTRRLELISARPLRSGAVAMHSRRARCLGEGSCRLTTRCPRTGLAMLGPPVSAGVSWTNEQNDGHPPCPRWCVGLRCLIGRRRSIRRRAVSLVLSARLGSDAWNDSRRVSDLFRVVLPLSPSSHQETPPDRAPEDSSRQTSDVCVGSVLP